MSKDDDEKQTITSSADRHEQELTTAEILGWSEFACWTMLVLTPFLYWVNGPSVSTDQFVVRTALVILSALGAVILRVVNWRRAKHARPMRPDIATH